MLGVRVGKFLWLFVNLDQGSVTFCCTTKGSRVPACKMLLLFIWLSNGRRDSAGAKPELRSRRRRGWSEGLGCVRGNPERDWNLFCEPAAGPAKLTVNRPWQEIEVEQSTVEPAMQQAPHPLLKERGKSARSQIKKLADDYLTARPQTCIHLRSGNRSGESPFIVIL